MVRVSRNLRMDGNSMRARLLLNSVADRKGTLEAELQDGEREGENSQPSRPAARSNPVDHPVRNPIRRATRRFLATLSDRAPASGTRSAAGGRIARQLSPSQTVAANRSQLPWKTPQAAVRVRPPVQSS